MQHPLNPYDAGDDDVTTAYSRSDDDSDGGSETTGSSPEEGAQMDGRMQAHDDWMRATQAWIHGPGRNPNPTPERILAPHTGQGTAPPPSAADLPTELRANDVVRHIINIDSQFRESPTRTTAADFYFRLLSTVRNVIRVRVTSVEFPNNYPFFTKLRRSVTLRLVLYDPIPASSIAAGTYTITIPEGNYTAGDMEDALNTALAVYKIEVVWNPVTGRFTFTNMTGFSIRFGLDTKTVTPDIYDRPIAYGLGYYLGFSRGIFDATMPVAGAPYTLTSNQCAHFAGDRYVFLKINDFDCVTQTATENDFTALAKLVLREPKDYMVFDDYASQHIKEVVFQNPRDLSRFHVRVLDPWGELVDMCSAEFSFSLEVLEIKNQSLFNAVRDSITLRYV